MSLALTVNEGGSTIALLLVPEDTLVALIVVVLVEVVVVVEVNGSIQVGVIEVGIV